MTLSWKKQPEEDPYIKRPKYVSDIGSFEITKEGDRKWWLRRKGNPVGISSHLSECKRRAQMIIDEESK